jgi:chromate reductase, NAD(P)H dehydrogenase (quinone)
MRILGLSGSLRRDSHNTSLLQAAGRLLPEGSELVVFDRLGEIPHFNEDDETSPPPVVLALKQAIEQADGLLVSTPEYNHSLPGVLKNAIDWASRPVRESALTNQTVSVIGASNGQFGAMWAQADLRKILGTAGARVVGDELPVARASEKFDASGRLLDAELFERLRLVLGTLASEAVPAGV